VSDDEGCQTQDEGDRRHHHRAESHLRTEDRRLLDALAGLALLLRELDDQNAVLCRECDQHDETDLRVIEASATSLPP
jgi:hypothetical protein